MSPALPIELLQLLLLIIIANGAPIITRALFNEAFNLAVDFGCKLPDNKPLFGPSKTWRGILSAITVTPVAAWLFAYSLETGLYIALYAIAGDLFSSFVKRRLALAPSSMAPLLDQVPESFLPAFMMMQTFHLTFDSVVLLVLLFIIAELVLSHTLYQWGIRKRPY